MKHILGLLGLLVLMDSCNDTINDSDFLAGEAFTNSDIRVMRIDTLKVETYTMKFDSVITSEASRMLIGKYLDPVFGMVKSSSYVEILPSNYSIDSEAKYDSIAFFLKYDKYYYNDTLQKNSIHLKEVSELLEPADGSNFYNTSKVGFVEEDLGYISYAPRPLGTDSLYVKLDDTFGTAIFEQLQQKKITNSEEFKNYFHGITFRPGEDDDGSIVGFSFATSIMRMYYTVPLEDFPIQKTIDFVINTSSSPKPFFNQMSVLETNEYLKTLTDKRIDLKSADSENRSFIQSGIGYTTKITFPNLRTVFGIQGSGTLLNAVLKIKPVKGSYNDELQLRDTLSLYIVDANNDLTQQLSASSSSGVLAILNHYDDEFNDIYYEIPLSSYIETLLLENRDTDEAIILLPNNYNSNVDRFVLVGNDGTDQNTKLELTYTIYDEDE